MLWGLGESSNTAEQPPACCPELDPPGSGAKEKAGQGRREEQVGGFAQSTKATRGDGGALCGKAGELGSSPSSPTYYLRDSKRNGFSELPSASSSRDYNSSLKRTVEITNVRGHSCLLSITKRLLASASLPSPP